MRFNAVLLSIALLAASAVAAFSQSPMMMESSGLYVNLGGGLAILPGTTDTPHDNLPATPKGYLPMDSRMKRAGTLISASVSTVRSATILAASAPTWSLPFCPPRQSSM